MGLGSKPVSIKDIARKAKVSHSTVSRALRGSPLVNPVTKERIAKIAGESNFRVSAVARSLVSGRTFTIGVVVTTIADPFNGEVVSGIEEAAIARGYSVFLANSKSDPHRELGVVHSFDERRVDGIIVTSSRVGELYDSLLASLQVPVVFLNNHNPRDYAYSVSIDNVTSARAAVRHLIELGHRRIAYLGDAGGMQSDRDRLEGYRAALLSAGIETREDLIANGDGKADGGTEAARRVLRLQPRPTALFCYNDMTALGALKAAAEAKLRVPEDLSIAGFDDLPMARFLQPPLTTIRQPMEDMGRRAMELLYELLNGGKPERNATFQGELIVRESAAHPPAEDFS